MRLIRLKEVMHKTGLARTTLYNYMQDDKFPQSVPLGDRAVAWIEEEVDRWIEQKVKERL